MNADFSRTLGLLRQEKGISQRKAAKELGWRAERGIEEMCEDSWRFIKNNPEGL